MEVGVEILRFEEFPKFEEAYSGGQGRGGSD